jgi:hypothetical protein
MMLQGPETILVGRYILAKLIFRIALRRGKDGSRGEPDNLENLVSSSDVD